MRILFEDFHYSMEAIPQLEGIAPIELTGGKVKFPYVGYYYDAKEGATFILPKVFIANGKALGRYNPEDLAHLADKDSPVSDEDKAFLFGVSAWIYQAITLFNQRHCNNEITSTISLAGLVGHRGQGEATLIDHILALLRFAREHQQLFTYIAIIQHSGNSKIHWTKTIRQTQPLLCEGKPYYLQCKTKSKTINYDEELIVLLFSTLGYLADTYHFVVPTPLNYTTLRPSQVAQLIEQGKGTRQLKKMRNKYFKDELVTLWGLLYAFYERAERVAQRKEHSERLLVRNFNIVFEDMIDTLIGESDLPPGLKEQKDGKVIDHIYRDKSIIGDGDIYFIGDSKYYQEDNEVGEHSIYKQFTYAKNVIQHQINLLNSIKSEQEDKSLRYRDGLTEGYNPTPSFFVRGFIDPEDLSYSDNKLQPGKEKYDINYHFPNRLFDRDTLLVFTYKINLLYVLSSYVQNGTKGMNQDSSLRKRFREDIISAYNEAYDFYELSPRGGLDEKDFVNRHFRTLIGKIYYTTDKKLILALRKGEQENEERLKEIDQDAEIHDLDLKQSGLQRLRLTL